jgi:amino acid transporter
VKQAFATLFAMFRSNKSSGKFADEPRLDDISAEEVPEFSQHYRAHNIDAKDDALIDPDSGVKRGLKNRHLSMMALAGIIGPGLLVGAGGALNSGGPASLIIGFGVIGVFLIL